MAIPVLVHRTAKKHDSGHTPSCCTDCGQKNRIDTQPQGERVPEYPIVLEKNGEADEIHGQMVTDGAREQELQTISLSSAWLEELLPS